MAMKLVKKCSKLITVREHSKKRDVTPLSIHQNCTMRKTGSMVWMG